MELEKTLADHWRVDLTFAPLKWKILQLEKFPGWLLLNPCNLRCIDETFR